GGGRYDGLVEALGGPPTPGIGFALGLDRILLACDDEGVFAAEATPPSVFVVDTTGGAEALAITAELRAAGLAADRAYDGRSMKAQMKLANRSDAPIAVIVGSDEVESGTVVVKPMAPGLDQQTIPRTDLVSHLKQLEEQP
ncbi:MAG: His/Gly/Thr/Pro-type tRNA ligase C-terminal domain-containing protein, partial [Actinomycetota bacterium]